MNSLLRIAGLVIVMSSAQLSMADSPEDSLPDDVAQPTVIKACTACHQAPQIVLKRRTPEEWETVVFTMMDRGALATEAEQDQIIDYFIKHFGVSEH